jgi:hypothetical protein
MELRTESHHAGVSEVEYCEGAGETAPRAGWELASPLFACGPPMDHLSGQNMGASSERSLAHRRTQGIGREEIIFAILPAKTNLRTLAATIKARWICEQAYQRRTIREQPPPRKVIFSQQNCGGCSEFNTRINFYISQFRRTEGGLMGKAAKNGFNPKTFLAS